MPVLSSPLAVDDDIMRHLNIKLMKSHARRRFGTEISRYLYVYFKRSGIDIEPSFDRDAAYG